MKRFRGTFVLGRIAALLLVAGALGACDDLGSPAPSAACSQIAARCQLPGGPIGVCQESPCAPGAVAPCFQCTPQH